jgi:hypothetical protein
MSMIHVNRNRETLGKFTDQEVADGLKSGRFLPTDLAWKEPMPAWQPLSTFPDLPEGSEGANEIPLAETPADSVVEPAWERSSGFSWSAAIETVKQVFSEPTATFQKLPPLGGFKHPLFFYIVLGWVGGSAAVCYQLIGTLINPEMFLGEAAKDAPPAILVAAACGVVVFLPLFLIAGAFISAGIYHALLLLVGGGNKGFEATFRALAYVGGATALLQLVPLCGGYIYPLANLVYAVIALKEVHRTDLWRVVLAALLLFMICCGVALLLGMAGLAVMSGDWMPKN